MVVRSLSAGLRHQARAALALTATVADRYGMKFQFATLPFDREPVRVLDPGTENMGRLYAYGRDCASRGLLWVSIRQAEDSGARAMDRVAGSGVVAANGMASCPLDAAVAALAVPPDTG